MLLRLWPHLEGAEVLSYRDGARGEHRFALFMAARLVAVLFLARTPVACDREQCLAMLGEIVAEAQSRLRILAGRAAAEVGDPGPTVCACLGIGRNRILACARANPDCSVEAVGAMTGAGTNCGSCRPEIGGLIDGARIAKAG
jgi:assimilatory nitrate reductase catalytic subunit